ncbi:MAG TPA: polymer-forming cytoskeletal protein [Pyrinomonadaceae bacterium]|nr:polymer-forming cytoskeletal protein [Pyrinomonadaceae bacterium]
MVNYFSLTGFQFSANKFDLNRFFALLFAVLVLVGVASAQNATEKETIVISGANEGPVVGLGKSVRVTGSAQEAVSLGGDVIVEGVVEGDVAAVGGSVIQKAGARIGGDVMVIGGSYRSEDPHPNRNPSAMTMMYAGYEQELRNMMNNPTGIFSPRWTSTYLGTRLLVILFWFLVSLGFTAAMPNTISRGVARLQLTSLRVAVIGFIGLVVLFGAVPLCLWIMPQAIQAMVGLLALLLLLVAGVFGRVILYAATGRWLQRKYLAMGKNSEAVALLLGTSFWVLLTSLPYVWPLVAAFVLIISFGLALTARYRVGWNS